jgi:hypothetical protein
MRLLCLVIAAALACLSSISTLQADEPSGYSGSVGLRGNYYWERSTRVVAPTANASLVTPSGVRFDATYLVDAITSASLATGVRSDVSFTEVRNDVSAGAGYEIDFGSAQLDLSLQGRFSKEPDYLSRGLGLSGAWSINERTTTLRLNGYFLHDEVSKIDRMAPAEDPTDLMATKAVPIGTFDALSLGLALDQVLSPTTIATIGYDAALLEGFQANAYRNVKFADGGGGAENHPETRIRNAYYVWLGQYVMATHSALRVGYRLYRDSWSILAHAPELRFHQEFGPYVELRLRYRYYTQTPAYFFREKGNLRADRYITDDPKMSRFHNQTIGTKLRVALDFLAFTPLDFAHRAVLDFGVEYIFNTNRFGNGLIGQGGIAWPF